MQVTATDPLTLTARAQYLITNLKAVPWSYGNETGETFECTTVLPKNNPLYLSKRVTKSVMKPVEKVPEEKMVKFLSKMGYNEAKVVKSLK